MTSSFSALCPSHIGQQHSLNCPCQTSFSRAQSWHSSWAAQQKHHKRTKHPEWFLTGYSEIYKRIYYWGFGFCLLIDFGSIPFSGQMLCIWERGKKRGREKRREREGERERMRQRVKPLVLLESWKNVCQHFQSLVDWNLQTKLNCSHPTSAQPCVLDTCNFLYIKVRALLHLKCSCR